MVEDLPRDLSGGLKPTSNPPASARSGAVRSGVVRMKTLGFGFPLAALLALGSCSSPREPPGSEFCDALGAQVQGIDVIVWENGFTRGQATWAALLHDGILHGNEASRTAAAKAVRSDTQGFERVIDAAPGPLRPDLLRLKAALLNPEEFETHRADPLVAESIQAVLIAPPSPGCNWVL